MNGSQSRKIRQLYKRDLRKTINKKVYGDAELWLQMLKAKPKYLPTFIWKLGARIYFSPIGLNQIYKTKI